MKRAILVVVLLALTGGATWMWYGQADGAQVPRFRTAPVERGNLLVTISATGTLQPEEVVDVGAQVAGMIQRFGTDPRDSTKVIDYGSPVEPGTVLAEIDSSIYRTQVDQAQANMQRAEADLEQLQARLVQAERDWERARQLGTRAGVISGLDYDTAQTAYLAGKAALSIGRATVAQTKAALKQAEINLGYTTIKSPVKGVIVDRRVNVGQTVVASLNAPSLFLIAKDLRRMQIWASVNEADIGAIRPGQPVSFTVDAHPGMSFRGEVAQIRLNANMTQNVVTYTVVVTFDNSNGLLLPYLTANVLFEVDRRPDALLVPNSALRWQPQLQQVAPAVRDASVALLRSRDDSGPADNAKSRPGVVWVAEGSFVRPVQVHVGLTDGAMTEVLDGELTENLPLVIGLVPTSEDRGGTTNPFAPSLFKGRKTAKE
jgi:HlyD family secretion protein